MATAAPSASALRALLSAAAEEWRATPFYQLSLRGDDPERIEQWGQDPRQGDRARGMEILAGQWRLGAERLTAPSAPSSPWGAAHPSTYFTARLHSFCWLADLTAAGGAREAVAGLVGGWVEAFGDWHEAAWAPELAAERIFAWLCHGRAAFETGDDASMAALRSLSRQARHLMLAAKDIRDPSARITAGAALTLAGAAGLPDGDRLLDQGEELLLEAVASQFFVDGGHQSRSPEVLFHALCDLLAANDAWSKRGGQPPDMLRAAPYKIACLLQLVMHGDGGLARFQGGGEGDAAALSRALAEAGAPETRRFQFATQSGFQRLQGGDVCLLMDVGGPPNPAYAARAHAGALAVELSIGAERMIVNVGAGRTLDPEWRAAARATAAHATLVVDDALSAPFKSPRRGRDSAYPIGPEVHAKRMEEDVGVFVEAQHDGYRDGYGFVTRRTVFMDPEGGNIRGHDSLSRPVNAGKPTRTKSIPFAVRFHLHPQVTVSRVEPWTLALATPSGRQWRFRTDAPSCRVEPSIYLGGAVKPQRTHQIVLRGDAEPSGSGHEQTNRIRWAFTADT